ncbi:MULTISPECIES: hypothetical protein [unclassified Cellulomonas]|uniref:hypothetical protein n=1 Tax=unclassified Cellulomonas TaxID=2620175 RepID=UPI00198689F2|nr:hypothetical protein [Cellulomonas sp. ES6]MBD3778414.1 hypothetical protein [Micrococcales bacterium]WHP16407.1 hypothetical protein P9841_12335 [Cellulomonas sp. ES6]
MLSGSTDALVEIVLRLASALVERVVAGGGAVTELAAQWSWTVVGPALGLVAVALVLGAWTAFWDD